MDPDPPIWAYVLITLFVSGEIASRVLVGGRMTTWAYAALPRWAIRRDGFHEASGLMLMLVTGFAGFVMGRHLTGNLGEGVPALVGAFALGMFLFRPNRTILALVRARPVEDTLEKVVWLDEDGETDFHPKLAAELHAEFEVPVHREVVVNERTKVDLRFDWEDSVYFISVKRFGKGDSNQKRLTLQGELEDIIEDAESRPSIERYFVFFLIGVPENDLSDMGQLDKLEASAVRRRGTQVAVIQVPIVKRS